MLNKLLIASFVLTAALFATEAQAQTRTVTFSFTGEGVGIIEGGEQAQEDAYQQLAAYKLVWEALGGTVGATTITKDEPGGWFEFPFGEVLVFWELEGSFEVTNLPWWLM